MGALLRGVYANLTVVAIENTSHVFSRDRSRSAGGWILVGRTGRMPACAGRTIRCIGS